MGGFVVNRNIICAPAIGLRAGQRIRIAEERIANAGRLDGALEQGRALMQQLQDLVAAHVANDGLVAKWQDIERHPVGDQAGSAPRKPISARRAARIVEDHVNIIGSGTVVVEIIVDGVIDKIPHQRVAIVVSHNRHVGLTDFCTDQSQIGGIEGIDVNDRFDRRRLSHQWC